MASLLDLGPLTEQVEVRGVQLTVRGLTAANLFKLFSEFPGLPQAMQQIGDANATPILDLAPDLLAKIIAMATGSPGNKEVEDKAKELGAADQMAILGAVQRLSFPQGFVPFVNEMTRLMGTETNQGNSSRAPSSASFQTDSPGMTRGDSPRAN
jgi:hypothetical protein